MRDPAAYLTYVTNAFPIAEAINSTGAATTDGTEFIAELINDLFMGPMQATLDYANLTPNGVTEAAGASQFLEAIKKGMVVGPGTGGEWWHKDDPSVTGHRALLLEGQGVLRASYPDADAAYYVGDGNNAAVAAGGGSGLSRGGFYHADDAAGTIPNIAGAYLILPDTRGRSGRGADPTGTVDPQGTLRFLGDRQGDSFQAFQVGADADGSGARDLWMIALQRDNSGAIGANVNWAAVQMNISSQGVTNMIKPMDDGTNGPPRTSSETVGANFLEVKYITY